MRYTISERWFMWKAHRMSDLCFLLADYLPRYRDRLADAGVDWHERGWECSQGM